MKKKSNQKLTINKKVVVSLNNEILAKIKGGTRTGDSVGDSAMITACGPIECY